MPTPKSPETAAKYWELYQQGFSLEKVGKAFGVSRQAVWDLLKNHGYELRKKREIPFIEYQGKRYVLDGEHYRHSEKGKQFSLHRVIWEQHKGSIPEGYSIYHINGDRSDNRIENLECLKHSDYQKAYGQRNLLGYCKKVRRLDTGEVYESIKEAARKVGIDSGSISHSIKRGGKSAGTKWEYVE